LRGSYSNVDEACVGIRRKRRSQGLRGKSSPLFNCQGTSRAPNGSEQRTRRSRPDTHPSGQLTDCTARRPHRQCESRRQPADPSAAPADDTRSERSQAQETQPESRLRRPASARAIVSSSAYWRSAPAGRPWASRVSRTPEPSRRSAR